jgi:hypothetical protein
LHVVSHTKSGAFVQTVQTVLHAVIQTRGKRGTDVQTVIQSVIQTRGKRGTDVQTVEDLRVLIS